MPKLAREIYAPTLFALRGRVLAAHIVVPHDHEAVGIALVLAELDVAPLQGHKLAAAEASPHGGEKQGVVVCADLFRSLKK
ncbi:MAG TPA: hypothetical protein VMO80_00640 [Terriglobales bacterium]|nr:hypothetical protein [Terriglobales bacterium]